MVITDTNRRNMHKERKKKERKTPDVMSQQCFKKLSLTFLVYITYYTI